VQKGVRCELVKLHTIDKEEPTEKLVGRKRKTAKEESNKHYPITARGLRDPLSTGKYDGILGGDEAARPGFFHILLCDGGAHPAGGRGGLGHGALGDQVFHVHLTQSALRGYAREEETEEISNGDGGGNELVNSKNSLLRPLYTFWEKDHGLKCGARSENNSPLTVKNQENYSAAHKTVRTRTE
jgi:hypothetical protein